MLVMLLVTPKIKAISFLIMLFTMLKNSNFAERIASVTDASLAILGVASAVLECPLNNTWYGSTGSAVDFHRSDGIRNPIIFKVYRFVMCCVSCTALLFVRYECVNTVVYICFV